MDHAETINISKAFFERLDCRISRYNRSTYVMNSRTDINFNFDDQFTVDVAVSASQGNEYRKILSKRIDNFCTYMSKDKIIYDEILKYCNLPPQGTCPILKVYI